MKLAEVGQRSGEPATSCFERFRLEHRTTEFLRDNKPEDLQSF